MIDIKQFEKMTESGKTYFDIYQEGFKSRGADEKILEDVLRVIRLRREAIREAEVQKALQNKISSEIGKIKRDGGDASVLLSEVEGLKAYVKNLEQKAADLDQETLVLSLNLPQCPHSSVPRGKSAEDNLQMKSIGTPSSFKFKALEHWELGEKLQIIDFERAAKTTGARFAFLKGAGAQMERALIQFMMDLHSVKHGYTEMIPPFIVNSQSLQGTGQFPKFKEDVFHLSGTDYYLIPTAEVPVTNYYQGETLEESDLPQKFVAYSPCFRSEAGSAGRDTRGLIRQHQFDKIELMAFVHPEASHELHEELTAHAEQVLLDLELPFRRMLLCTGDMGFSSVKTYDLEVWLPGQQAYREISSCSNFEDFQSRRANIRFRPQGGGKPQFVHTLNGSGLAVGRTLIAILENYQQEDGSVLIPKVLVPYMGGLERITFK